MTVALVVQARMGSTRLPGKVLADLAGRPMLQFMLDRLTELPVDALVVATSTLDRDRPVAEVAAKAGFTVVRGSEQDVLGRFLAALDQHPCDDIIRLTADCPLIDPELVMATLKLHRERGADYTSNVLPRTFPQGLDVEVARACAIRRASDEAMLPLEREHVTPYLYRNPQIFRLANLSSGDLLGDERWTVDTPEDLAFVRSVVDRFGGDHRFGWRAVLDRVGRRFAPPKGQVWLRAALSSDRRWLQDLRNDPISVAFSGTGRAVGDAEHEAWFSRAMESPGTRIWIGEVDGQSVGMVRIDVEAAVGEVSIAVAAAQRGRGVGTALLKRLEDVVGPHPQVDRLCAVIDHENSASVRAFRAAGFGDDTERDGRLVLRWPALRSHRGRSAGSAD